MIRMERVPWFAEGGMLFAARSNHVLPECKDVVAPGRNSTALREPRHPSTSQITAPSQEARE